MFNHRPFYQKAKPELIKVFIDGLMAKMTLAEKQGQLNLYSAGEITTGHANSFDRFIGFLNAGKRGRSYHLILLFKQ